MPEPSACDKSPLQWRKKPVVVEAVQWFKLGDHPRVSRSWAKGSDHRCEKCGQAWGKHAEIVTLESKPDMAQHVCPGDWIITGVHGENYPCKPDIFAATYEPASLPSPIVAPRPTPTAFVGRRLSERGFVDHETLNFSRGILHEKGYTAEEIVPLYEPPVSVASVTLTPRWLVRAGGDSYDTWLCVYRAEVRNAFSEALYGSIESAEVDEVNAYMKAVDEMPTEEKSRRWNFEDGYLEVIRLNGARSDEGTKA